MKKEHSRCLKRIVAAALVLLTVSGAVPVQPIAQTFSTAITASAAEITDSGEFDNGVKWTLDSEGKLTVSGEGEIPNSAFYNLSAIKSVVIENGIKSIGDLAFAYCYSLTSVTIPDSVTIIGNEAFYSCSSLTSVTIPDSVTIIGNEAFYRCSSLTSVTISDGVESIGDWAFCHCSSLTSVTIPKNVTSIGGDTFYYSDSITDVYCYADPAKLNWTDRDGDDFIKNPRKTTVCHVLPQYLSTYQSDKFSSVNVTFVGDLVPTAISNIVYTGKEQALVTAGIANGGEWLYSLSKDGEYSDKIPTGKDAGDYIVWYKIYGTEPESVSVTIEKADSSVNLAPAAISNIVYNGEAQALVTAGTANGGELLYSLSKDGEYSAAVPTATEAGKYTVYYKVKGDSNHKDTEPESVNIEIEYAKAPLVLSNLDGAVLTDANGNALTAEEGTYTIEGAHTYYLYTNKSVVDNDIIDSSAKNKKYDGNTYSYRYTIEIPAIPAEEGYVISHANNWAGRVMTGDTTKLHVTEDGIWDNAVTAAVLKGERDYYYGDQPEISDVTITDGYGSIVTVDEVYFSNSQGTRVTKPVSGEKYYVTAKLIVDQSAAEEDPNNDTSVLYLKKEIEYKARPLDKCNVYLVETTENGEKETPLTITENGVTIPDKYTYTTKEQTVTVRFKNPANGETLSETDCTLTEDSKATGKEAGNYNFTYSAVEDGNYSGTLDFAWKINKATVDSADITITPNDSIVYDGKKADFSDFTVTANENSALAAELLNSCKTDGSFNENAALTFANGDNGISAGEHKAVFTFKNDNYNDVVVEKSFEISKRNVEIYPDEGQSKIYGQSDPTLTFDVEAAKDNSVTGLVEGDSKDIFNNALALENDYDGTVGFWNVVLNDNFTADNYVVSYTEPVQLEVTPKQLTADFFALDNDSFVYNGKKNTVKVTDFEDKDNDSAVLTENDFDTAGTFSAYIPGSYSVEIKGQGNYTGTAYLKWTIAPNTDTSASTIAESYVYDGTAHEVSVTANDDKTLPNNSQITYEYYAVETNEDGEIVNETKLDAAPVNAGYYKVQGIVTARGYDIDVTPAYFTISQKQIAITVNSDDLTLVYDSEAKEIGYTYDDTLIVDGDEVEVSGTISVVGDHTDVKYDDEGNIAGYDVDLSGLTISNSNYTLVLPENIKYFVTPRDIEDTDIQITKSEIALPDVGKATVEFKVVVNGKELVEDKDYDVAGTFAISEAGTYNVQVAGIGNYSGIALADWSVVETNDDKKTAIAAIEEAASLLIEEPVATVIGGKNRVALTVKGSVNDSDKYTITKTGIVYYNENGEPSEELTLDNVNGTEIKQAGKNGKTEYTGAIYDADYGIYARGYITVTDGTYTTTKYTDVLNTSYAEINAKKALYDAAQVTLSEPTAVVVSNKNRVVVKVTSSVNDSDKYTIVRTGLVYYNSEGEPAEELALDNVDGTEIKQVGKDEKTEYAAAVYDAEYGVYVRGYVTVTDGINTVTKYTDVLNTSYAEIEAGDH